MCGITGAIWTDPAKAVDAALLARMTDVLRHRGPDGEGTYRTDYLVRPPYEALPGIALGHRRLAIIDLATGRQPISNEDESIWIVFNGEIYNYEYLRRRLEGSGHKFRTESDTETIVHLYEDEGPNCFEHLNGMFAVAIWDANRRRLVLARDRLGKKPLVYRAEPDRLLFASELKSLLQVPGLPREIDPSAIDEYLTYQYIPHPNTIFRGFKKLPPGHWAVWQDGELEVQPYWQPDFAREWPIKVVGTLRVPSLLSRASTAIDGTRSVPTTVAEAIEQLRQLLQSAVEVRLRSDVPLGAFLSGGIDSSLVVALMQQLSTQPVKTFTIGFPVKEYDESKYAEQVAAHLKTDHQTLQVTPDAVGILPKLAWHYDEPFGDSSAIPTWYLAQLTRQHVTVALSGDGGDELFAGYPRYWAVALGSTFDRWSPLKTLLGAGAWQWLPTSGRQKSKLRQFKRFSAALSLSPERRYLDWISIFNESRRAELYNDDFLAQLSTDPAAFLRTAWKRCQGRDPVSCASLTDLVTYLPCDLMTKVDIASMAHGLECRAPFLDFRLVEFAAALPAKLKYRRGRGKWLLQAAFGELLPPEVWRRPKMGFGVPLDHWFRSELKELTHDTLLGESSRLREFLRPDAVQALVTEHARGNYDHSARLWALVMLAMWLREWEPARSTPELTEK